MWNKRPIAEIADLAQNRPQGDELLCVDLEHISPTTGQLIGGLAVTGEEVSKLRFSKEDVLFAKLRPYLRKAWLADRDGICSSEFWVFKARKGFGDPSFIRQFVLSEPFLKACAASSGSKMPRADWSYVETIKFPLPPIAEQRKIADILRTWDEAIETAEAELKAKQERKRGLMRNLLTPGSSGQGVASVAVMKRKMPKDWKMGRLGDLAKGARGVSFSPEKLLQNEDANSVILLRSNNIKEGKLNFDEVYHLPKEEVQLSQIAAAGDLAVCMSNGSKRLVGKAARITREDAGKNICVGAFCSLFKPTNQACTDIIPYLFDSDFYRRELHIILSGSAINNLKNSDIENVPAIIPPLDVQRKIAKILVSVDGDIELINQRIEALRAQKRGLTQKLLTGEVRIAV